MAKAIATVSGVALKPGVSRNRRLYTREHIAGAVARAQEQLTGSGMPLTQRTHHAAEDDSTKIVGRITSLSLDEDGNARYTAEIADTEAGRTVASLLDTTDGRPPFLSGVSIRGAWDGSVRRVKGPDGEPVETGSALTLMGLDYTASPGVPGANVDTFAWAKDGASETDQRVPITESVQEALVTISEDTAPVAAAVPDGVREALRTVFGEPVNEADTPSVSKRGSGLSDDAGRSYADPGYQKDKKQRYDLSTRQNAKSAWAYVSKPDNAKLYTGPQLKQVKKRIVAALKKFGVTVAAEGWCIDPALQVTEALVEYMGGDPDCAGSYSLSATNGPTTVTVCSYGLDPADLQVILAKACAGAGTALSALDPDMDGDIDVPGAESEDTDGDAASVTALPDNGDGVDSLVARMMAAIRGESAEDVEALVTEARNASAPVTETGTETSPAPVPDAEPQAHREEPAVSEATTTEAVATAPAAAPAVTVPEDLVAKYQKKLAKKEAQRRLAAGAAESAPAAAVTETDDERIARIVAAQVATRLGSGVQETEDQKIARLVEERLVTERQRITEQGGGPGRKGLSPASAVSETAGTAPAAAGLNAHGLPTDWPDKPLHQFSTDELDTYVGPAVTRHYLGARADLLA